MAHLIKRPNGVFAAQFKDITRSPQVKRWSLGTRDESEAGYLLKRIQEDMGLGYDPWYEKWDAGWRSRALGFIPSKAQEPAEQVFERIRLSEAINRYTAHLERDLKKPATIEKAEYVLIHFSRHLKGNPVVTKVTDEDIHRFLYTKNEYRKRTIREYRGVISRFYGWCLSEGIATENPCDGVRTVGKSKKIPKYLMPDEVDHLCEVIRKADAAKPKCWKGVHLWLIDVIRANVYLALRRSEIVNLEFEHINWDAAPVLLKVVVDEKKGVDTKSSKERVIPVHPKAAHVLRRLRKRHGGMGHVFRCARGKKLRKDHITHLFQQYRVEAKQPEGITLHSLRHTALSWMAMLGADIETIRLFAGHEDYETSQLYLHVAPRVFRDNALNCLDKVDQLRGVTKEDLW